jgi:hypothetical protein
MKRPSVRRAQAAALYKMMPLLEAGFHLIGQDHAVNTVFDCVLQHNILAENLKTAFAG